MLFTNSIVSILAMAAATSVQAGEDDNSGYLRKLQAAKLEARSPLPAWPFGRFQEFDSLTAEQQIDVYDGLDYNKKIWNMPGTNPYEELSFYTINLTSLGIDTDVEVQVEKAGDITAIDVIMDTLEITDEDVWDCWLNHYADYDWEDLIEYEVVEYIEALGWTEQRWYDEDYPPSDDKYWYELTEDEQTAAEAICYFPELWSTDVEIGQWMYQPDGQTGGQTSGASGNVTVVVDVTRIDVNVWDLPKLRFIQWDLLSVDQRSNATVLGYNETTWNAPGTGIETNYTKYESFTPEQMEAATELGINKFFWDCLINHYWNYNWNELPLKGVRGLWETLGWTFESWHGLVPPPELYNATYTSLNSTQQEAAEQLCYLPETYQEGGVLSDINLQALTEPPSTP